MLNTCDYSVRISPQVGINITIIIQYILIECDVTNGYVGTRNHDIEEIYLISQ